MKVSATIFVVLAASLFSMGQDVEVSTRDGKTVILRPNGTWAYKEETPTATKAQQKPATPNPEAELDKGDWIVKYYVDKFGKETNQPHLTTSHLISGTFGNSATRNSDLLVKVLYDADNGLAFEFYEYSKLPYSAILETEYYSVSIQDGKGNQHDYPLGALIREGSFRFQVLSSYNKKKNKQAEEVLQCLLDGGTVKFLLERSGRKNQIFRFDVDADGFSTAFKGLTEPKPTPSQVDPTPKPSK